ncbi:MAG TPA: tetraacyldisaccharide 4'-kinase [Vicinamibacterales bacterium]|jgi:tetraacyldisaccharide 4'-kinase
MSLASFLYAAVARERRQWYARRPGWRHKLARPVVSVGNVAVGGSGKTPAVSHIARLLQNAGQRPAILTRGYARALPSDGVTVVSDGQRLLADLDLAGDEPLMLARQLPTVPVLVSSDRYLAGRLAERHFGCTVHVLDDGFQHFQLERDLDLVLLSPEDVERPVTLPSGRLREPLDAVRRASAVIVSDADDAQAAAVGGAVGVSTVFRLRRVLDRPRLIDPAGRIVFPAAGTRVLAVAGLARPERFFVALASEGWNVADHLVFRDHHRYTVADIDRIVAAMRAARAVMVLTTEKDLARMLPLCPLPVPVAWVPLIVSIEPAREFGAWLLARLAQM